MSPPPRETFYAHTTDGPQDEWEPLYQHLEQVAIGANGFLGARQFAEAFGCGQWGELAGFWHDLGKYSSEFQQRIGAGDDPESLEINHRVDHSTAGAKHAVEINDAGYLLAYVIAGHHGGMPDMDGPGRSTLRYRLNEREIKDWSAAPRELSDRELPNSLGLVSNGNPSPFSVAFRIRMLFSCLVDADWLWTEYFYSPEMLAVRRQTDSTRLIELVQRLSEKTNQFQPTTQVKKIRSEILGQCRSRAHDPPGFFSLHVPTGGGKTLSSLAFALEHAVKHQLRRVIYAIPLTSIIEQTAKTFAEIFGDDAVLEHHSGLSESSLANRSMAQRLATENFDAPLTVTTNVQVLETLFANTPAKCRKLHRFAGSVVIFDEVQTLPVDLLRPTLAALRELVVNHGCTIVLCSATQPAILHRDDFEIGLTDVRPIIDDPAVLHDRLRRTTVNMIGQRDVDQLAAELLKHRQSLCIVNSRRHARELTEALDGDVIHLSANLCGEHRSHNVQAIKRLLDDKQSICRVVSTTVIEAGVDVDFPVVYRAIAGADSIAQAAGRCNREGHRDKGPVYVFEYDRKKYPSVDLVRDGIQAFEQIAEVHQDDLLSPEAIEAYFEQLYFKRRGDVGPNFGWDRKKDGRSVMQCFGGTTCSELFDHQFKTAASIYRLISQEQTSIVVPYQKGTSLIESLKSVPEEKVDAQWLRNFDRQCRRFTVNVYEQTFRQLDENTTIAERFGRFYLTNRDAYDRQFGLNADAVGMGFEGMYC